MKIHFVFSVFRSIITRNGHVLSPFSFQTSTRDIIFLKASSFVNCFPFKNSKEKKYSYSVDMYTCACIRL